MLLREIFLREDDRSTAVFAFGRFNPPTIGHQKLIDTVITTAEKANAKPYLFLSHKQNNRTDPLTFAEKQAYIQQYYPKLAVGDANSNTHHKGTTEDTVRGQDQDHHDSGFGPCAGV
jgi:nicotinic acid mononucleotide adenylyltransferase